MSKYILSYDEADVEAGKIQVDSDGVLKGAGVMVDNSPLVGKVLSGSTSGSYTLSLSVEELVTSLKNNRLVILNMAATRYYCTQFSGSVSGGSALFMTMTCNSNTNKYSVSYLNVMWSNSEYIVVKYSNATAET